MDDNNVEEAQPPVNLQEPAAPAADAVPQPLPDDPAVNDVPPPADPPQDEPADHVVEGLIDEEMDQATQTVRFRCNRCENKIFKHKRRALNHARTHFATPGRTCPRCGRVFSNADKKETHHENVHNPECLFCGGSFDGSRAVRRHMNTTACGFQQQEALGNVSERAIRDFPYGGLLDEEDYSTSEEEDAV